LAIGWSYLSALGPGQALERLPAPIRLSFVLFAVAVSHGHVGACHIIVSHETLTSERRLCQLRQETDTVSTVIRPVWSAKTEAQRKALAEAVRLARKADEAEEAAWAAILKARELDVPDLVLCEQTGRSRATLNRKYGARSTPKARPNS
jgi:hypothetical protein